MKFSVDLDIYGALKLTNAIAKQIPFAMAKALTQTAIQAQTDIVQAMAQVYGVDGKTLVVRGSHPDFAYITNKWGEFISEAMEELHFPFDAIELEANGLRRDQPRKSHRHRRAGLTSGKSNGCRRESAGFKVYAVADHHDTVQRHAWFRTIPGDEFFNRIFIRPPRRGRG